MAQIRASTFRSGAATEDGWWKYHGALFFLYIHDHHGPLESVEPLATYLEIRNYDRFNGAVLDGRLALVARSGADQGWSPTVGVDGLLERVAQRDVPAYGRSTLLR